jgi:uncharacterized protein YecE (DUF72 family)
MRLSVGTSGFGYPKWRGAFYPEKCEDETSYLLDVTGALGSKLGVLLFQLPPNLKLDLERLDRFLELLPDGTPAAFEFRNPGWLDPVVHERLRARSFAWVVNDDADEESADLLVTAPRAYLRLRREGYARDELAAWAGRLRARGLEEAFVFFKHEDAGAAPKMAGEFLEVAARAERRRGPRAAAAAGRKRDREVG